MRTRTGTGDLLHKCACPSQAWPRQDDRRRPTGRLRCRRAAFRDGEIGKFFLSGYAGRDSARARGRRNRPLLKRHVCQTNPFASRRNKALKTTLQSPLINHASAAAGPTCKLQMSPKVGRPTARYRHSLDVRGICSRSGHHWIAMGRLGLTEGLGSKTIRRGLAVPVLFHPTVARCVPIYSSTANSRTAFRPTRGDAAFLPCDSIQSAPSTSVRSGVRQNLQPCKQTNPTPLR